MSLCLCVDCVWDSLTSTEIAHAHICNGCLWPCYCRPNTNTCNTIRPSRTQTTQFVVPSLLRRPNTSVLVHLSRLPMRPFGASNANPQRQWRGVNIETWLTRISSYRFSVQRNLLNGHYFLLFFIIVVFFFIQTETKPNHELKMKRKETKRKTNERI